MRKIYDEDISIINQLPGFIRLEIIKQEFLKIYIKEAEFEENNVKYNNVSRFDYSKVEINHFTNSLLGILKTNYSIFSSNIERIELSEEDKIKLYRWCKQARRELKLKDNLLNIFELYIAQDDELKKINDEINNQKYL